MHVHNVWYPWQSYKKGPDDGILYPEADGIAYGYRRECAAMGCQAFEYAEDLAAVRKTRVTDPDDPDHPVLDATPAMTQCTFHFKEGPQCCVICPDPGKPHEGLHRFKCAGKSCPGLPWPASVQAHPYSCTIDPVAACANHWHCDPALSAHLCEDVDRARPCPSCGATVRNCVPS